MYDAVLELFNACHTWLKDNSSKPGVVGYPAAAQQLLAQDYSIDDIRYVEFTRVHPQLRRLEAECLILEFLYRLKW